MRQRRALLVGAVVVAVGLLGSATLVGTAQAAPADTALALPGLLAPTRPDQDGFYRPPSDLDGSQPGDLIRYRKSQVYLDAARLLPAPVRAWQVLYRSTSARGGPSAASGTVLVPDAPWGGPGPRPIVAYTVGTHGLGDQCAPSYLLASGTEHEFGLMSQALGRGWALAVTDYEGLGTPGEHSYAVQLAEGRATLDAVRAATRLPGAGLSGGAQVGIWGYSQGGGAAAAAAEQARHYAGELHVVGVAAGGVPADLRAVARNLDGSPYFGLLAGAAAGYDTAYPGLRMPELLNAKGRQLVKQVREECVGETVLRHGGRRLAEYTTVDDPLGYPPLARVLQENRIGGGAPDAPVLVYHAQLDQLIPLAIAKRLFAEYCQRDVVTRYVEIPGAEHVAGAVAGAPGAVAWLADRFDGRPAPNSCRLSD